ncbi:MAG: DUF4386 family protein [Bacillota bacterium]
MYTKKHTTAEETSTEIHQWKRIYLIGGIAALLSFFFTLSDIIIGSAKGVNLAELPQTAIERFLEFQQNWLLGLYHLDFLNAVISIIMIPAYFALFAVHRKRNLPYAALSLVIFIIGTTIFVATNSALPMLELSSKYFSTSDETQKMLFAAAGEAMLIRGGHGSLGVFIGFLFSSVASLCMSIVMVNGKVFSRMVSYFGVIGNMLLFIYILLVTFVPAVKSIAVMLAAPGGLLALAWVFMYGIKLIKLGRQPS